LLQNKETNLGKAAELILFLREELVKTRNPNFVEQYAEKACRLCKECKISSTALQKRWKINRKLEDFIVRDPLANELLAHAMCTVISSIPTVPNLWYAYH